MKLNVRSSIAFGTNISTIEVPDALRKRTKSSIKYFDELLSGGFTPSVVTLFAGTPGAGKTTMLLSVADALMGNGSIVVFNTMEESLFQVKMTAERLKLKNGFLTGEMSHIPTLLKECDKIRAANPGKQFFLMIDSLPCCDDGHWTGNDGVPVINSKSAERSLSLITEWCKSTLSNAIVINQVTKSGEMAGSQKLRHICDQVISLKIEEKDPELRGCRILEIEKNRFGVSGVQQILEVSNNGLALVATIK